MKIGLAGWGVETISAYNYFGPEHSYVICSEEPRDDFPTGDNIEIHFIDKPRQPGLTGNVADLSYLDPLADCELIVIITAARKNLEKHFGLDNEIWTKITDAERLFFENSPTKNIIGITGTKGKGTTSTLIHKMLEASGHQAWLGGNIGNSPLDFIRELDENSWVVLEFSSFQLYKFPYSPHIAVHLMMVPEHIEEWHKTMVDYIESKRNIFFHQHETDYAIYCPFNEYSTTNVAYSAGVHIPYYEKPGAYVDSEGYLCIQDERIVHKNEVALLGEHNLQNICAAVTAFWRVSHDKGAIKSVITTFSGLEHRLQLVGEINGAKYYDDSFGTTPDTTLVALDAFDQKKVLIVGGHDKGTSFDKLAKRLCSSDLRHVIFIGITANKIYKLAKENGFNPDKASIRDDSNSWTMTEIVDEALKHSEPGDVVLLSTGCSSFGMFKNYKDRGNQFKDEVRLILESK